MEYRTPAQPSPKSKPVLNLMSCFLIRSWWQLVGWQQLRSWCSVDKMMQGKGLQLLYHLVFFDCLRKQNSEEEEEDEEKKEEESLSLDPLKPYYPSKDTPVGNGFSTIPPQPSCSSEGLPRATETQEQALTQPPSPSRSFPTLKTLTGSSLKQKKSQLFWGLPSLHSESLETIFLSSDHPSSLKRSICPVFFNKVPSLCVYDLLLSYYDSSTSYPTLEAHTLEDLEKIASGSQLVQSPPFPPIPPVSSNLKPLLKGYKRIIPNTKAHTQWFTQNKEDPCVSENQALYPQPKLQKIRSSTFLYSSKAWREMAGDLSLYQHNPELLSASLLYPSSPQEVLDRFEMPWITRKQNEHPKVSETAMQTASLLLTSLTEGQRVNPTGDLSQLKTLWEIIEQKEKPQIYELPISDPCQLTVPMTEGTGSPGTPPGYEAQWGIIVHKDIPQAFYPLMSVSCQPSGSLSEVKNVNPKERLSTSKDFRENMGYRENPPVSNSPVSVPYPPLDTLLEHHKESPLEDVSGFKSEWQCKENSGSPWGCESPTLDSNMGFYETIPMCVPLGSDTQLKGTPSIENLCVYADIVSSPSASLPDFAIMDPQRIILESKALWEIKEQKKHLWVSDSPPLVPFIEPQRINTVDDVPRSEATGNNTENTRNCLSSEPPFLNLNPSSPALLQQPLRVSPIENPFKSKAWCGDTQAWCGVITQRKNNFLASELQAQSLSQHLLGPSPAGVLSDFESAGGLMKQNENHCVSVVPVWESSPPPNSVLKFHISGPSGDQCNYKPTKSVVEWTKDSWANELPAPSFFSALLQELHPETEFVCRNVLEREASQGSNPPVVNPLQPTSCPIQPGLQKKEMFSEAKAEAPSPQGEAVSEVYDHPVIHAWQWSRELKLRLKKLQQSPTFKSPESHDSFCSSPVLNLTPESLGLSSCPQQTYPLSLHPCSSSSHLPKVQRAEALPIQVPHCSHSSQPQIQVSGRSEQESQKNERMKWKTMVQIPSLGHGHIKADEKVCSGMGDPSNTGVLVSGKRQDKTLILLSTQHRSSSRKFKAEKCERTARLGSPNVTRKSKPAQACIPSEVSTPRFSKKSQYKAHRSPHSALAQELLPNAAGPQDRQGIGLVAGDTQNPCPCKHCPWILLKQQLPSSSSKAPPTRGFQKLLDKFLRVHRPLSTKSSQ